MSNVFTVTTSGLPSGVGTVYWTVDGTTDDFVEVSGTVEIVQNSATFEVTAIADAAAEGPEAYTISIRTGSITGPVVDTYSITVADTSAPVPTFDLTGPATINEDGANNTYTITTTDFVGTLYWTINGTTSDFAAISGAETIVANTATFDISALADSITEGNEAYTISLRTGSILGAVVDTLDITVIDTSLNAPTYNLTGPATIDEDGLANAYTITTTFVPDATTLYWTIDGTTADFTAINGSSVITSNSGTFDISAIVDALTEGDENYTISLRTTSISGTVVDTLAITVIDTSLDVAYDLTGPITIEETGLANTYTITTTSVPDATTLYWTIDGTTADFTTINGSSVITSSSGTFDLTAIIADNLTEGDENYTISLRTDSISGTVVDTLAITVTDTSLSPPTYDLTGPISINETDLPNTYTITTTSVPDATTLLLDH